MFEQFNIENFRTQKNISHQEQKIHNGLPRHKKREKFLSGPIPWNWLTIASHLPGRGLHIGIGIWHLGFITHSNTIHLTGKILNDLGVNRQATYRALKALEKAGLIYCTRAPGRRPTIKILNVQTKDICE